MKYRIGLDLGIGSVGWAVVSVEEAEHPAQLEDFGVRIFDSGEHPKKSQTLCSIRRQGRGVRRLERRRSNRKKLLKNHFQNIGLIGSTFNDDFAACKDADVYALKSRGLDEKLTAAELYKCLAHTCNHRGYKDFYEPDPNDAEAGKLESAANAFENAFRDSGKRTVSEYLLAEKSENGFVKFRNRAGGSDVHTLIRRDLLRAEAAAILAKQSEYYPCLTERNSAAAVDIIFNQRDFEDGPGDPNDTTRRYHGFLESLGKCPFYKAEDRGFRGTVIADVFAVTNTLSQYRYVDCSTGEYRLDGPIAAELVDHLLQNASLKISDVKVILKKHNYVLQKPPQSDAGALTKSVKYLALAKAAVEEAGFDWTKLIAEPQFDPEHPSLLHRIGELMSKFQTPSRRKQEMRQEGIDPALIKTFSGKKFSGTASASDRYMCDAIAAFLSGDVYGNFQAKALSVLDGSSTPEKSKKLLPAHIDDPDVCNNRVVFKAINETRKIVNAIIDLYGSPEEIVVEVASELGKGFDQRNEDRKHQQAREKATEEDKKKISELLGVSVDKVSGSMLERYRLFIQQDGQSVYSGKPLDTGGGLAAVIRNSNREYEIDHVIPYSLILDNTLENKVLVFASENQRKGQRAPLDWLQGTEAAEFKKRANRMYTRKENAISKKKLAYLLQPSIFGKDAEELLSQWKSRNINDTRYITKYVCGIFNRYLQFAGDKKLHVTPVKGSVTQRFRRVWFNGTPWGDEKDRSTYLHHAVDAAIAANLTRPYIEIGSDALRLISIFKYHKRKYTPEYYNYLDSCVDKMKKYYGFGEDYTRSLLSNISSVPSCVPKLAGVVASRVERGVIVSQKQERKFRGEISDANPVRIEMIDGQPHKITRKSVSALKPDDLASLRTDDPALLELLKTVLDQYGSVEKYLTAHSLDALRDPCGHVIRKVTLDGGVMLNYYRVDKGAGNFANLGAPKYYCVEVYRDKKGKTRLLGLRYVDFIQKNGKLFLKRERIPADYAAHVLYLFKNDYVTVTDKNGVVKMIGYYRSVKNLARCALYFRAPTAPEDICVAIAQGDIIKKYAVSMLGKRGGEIGGGGKRSEQFPLTPENE